MKRLVVGLLFATVALWAAPTIDGVITPGEGWILVGSDAYATGGGAGAHLGDFYYYRDAAYLYLAFSTQNTESWNLAYGIALDPQDPPGYVGVPGTDVDAWNRYITFDNPPTVNWEFYWYWDGASGSITAFNECQWTGSGWNYQAVGNYAYTGDAATGLQQLEYQVAWSDLEFNTPPDDICLALWIAGADNNTSAVDVIPQDPTVSDGGGSEWTDTDDQLGCIMAPVAVHEGNLTPTIRVTPVLNGLRVAADHPVTITLYRANGQKVLTQSVSGFLNLRNLEKGVYLYHIAGTTETGKVVVIH